VGGGGLAEKTSCNLPPDPPYPADSLEGSEVHVYATTSHAVRPNPGLVVAAGGWLLTCVSLFLLLGLQILRRVGRRTG
jgi:hypothetical protein